MTLFQCSLWRPHKTGLTLNFALFGPFIPEYQNLRIKFLSYFFYILYIVLLSNDHLWSVLNIQLFINECHCNIFSIVKISLTLSELFTWLNMVFLFNVSINCQQCLPFNTLQWTDIHQDIQTTVRVRENFFSVWHWVRQELGFWLTRGLCVCPTIFL